MTFLIAQVPVLHDGDKAINESFEIAQYLEKTYPDAPSLFGGESGEAGCFFANAFADTVMMRKANPFIVASEIQAMVPSSTYCVSTFIIASLKGRCFTR